MEELKLYEGRPADCTGRLEKEIRTYDLLDKLGIQFWRTDHGWMKADTMEDCHVIDACLNATVCKNLFLCNRQKTNFYLLMMPGDKPFKTKELSHQLGIARLSFASPEDMEQYLDCTPGSSSIMGLANDAENKVQLLMDEDIKAGEYLGCHPCINTSSLKLRTADVLETFLPAVHHEPIDPVRPLPDRQGKGALYAPCARQRRARYHPDPCQKPDPGVLSGRIRFRAGLF